MMALLYDGRTVGSIASSTSETHACSGQIHLTDEGKSFLDLWNYIERTEATVDPPYPPEWMTDDRWAIDENGQRRPIYFPMVYRSGSIVWQWRFG